MGCGVWPEGRRTGKPEPLENGKESIYIFVNLGTKPLADQILDDVWDLGPRTKPFHLPPPIQWTEDPDNDPYWAFVFYGLRPLRSLLWAYYTFHDVRYRDKLIEVMRSYVKTDAQRPNVPVHPKMDDPHAVAFRAMILTNTFWKLKNSGELPADLEEPMRQSIRRTAAFLDDPKHFQSTYNHGYTESAAQLLVAVNFPEFQESAAWQKTGTDRLNGLMETAVDPDGVEIENSPFYHLYVLTFCTQDLFWAQRYGVNLGDSFGRRTAAMLPYVSFNTMPNGHLPQQGASVDLNVRKIDQRIYADDDDAELSLLPDVDTLSPAFHYMRTAGALGVEPDASQRNVRFAASGQAVMRSAFGKTDEMAAQTHIALNVGRWRTMHSHRDVLGFNYYSAGRVLLPDSGLFTYDRGADFDYFNGTRSHNTVVVDGLDQNMDEKKKADVHGGLMASGEKWLYQSGLHGLYEGVTHARSVLLLERDLTLVLDSLNSTAVHDYVQTWHLFPEAEITNEGLDVIGSADGKPLIAVRQALTDGVELTKIKGATQPMQGWTSIFYGKKDPNWALEYKLKGTHARFGTLLASGDFTSSPARVSVTFDEATSTWHASVCVNESRYAVEVHNQAGDGESVSVVETPTCP
jgi:hypothetical protein